MAWITGRITGIFPISVLSSDTAVEDIKPDAGAAVSVNKEKGTKIHGT